MALFRRRSRRAGIWLEAPKALRGVAAVIAFSIMPAAVSAQTMDGRLPTNPDVSCVSQPNDRPVQMAMQPLAKVEPGSGPFGWSGTAATSGDMPSRLEQMRMMQAGGIRASVATNAALRPALASPAPCAMATHVAAPIFATEPAFLVPENAILGTLSVAIEHTPFDRDWAAASARQGSRKMHQTLSATGARRSADQAAQVEAVNRWVNRKIKFGEDRDVYGRPDYWAPASETLRRRIGDCEDFAIAKMELLLALGISSDKMRLVVARDLARNADHAVLVVMLASGAVMLDNMTDQLLDARLPNDYRPIMSFSQNMKWIHGEAVQPTPTIKMAAMPTVAAHDIADVQIVTQAPEMPAIAITLLSSSLPLPTLL